MKKHQNPRIVHTAIICSVILLCAVSLYLWQGIPRQPYRDLTLSDIADIGGMIDWLKEEECAEYASSVMPRLVSALNKVTLYGGSLPLYTESLRDEVEFIKNYSLNLHLKNGDSIIIKPDIFYTLPCACVMIQQNGKWKCFRADTRSVHDYMEVTHEIKYYAQIFKEAKKRKAD